MAEKLLDGAKIRPVAKKMRRESMTKRVRCYMRRKIELKPE